MNKKNADLLEILNSTHPTSADHWTATLKRRKIGGKNIAASNGDEKILHKRSKHQAAAMSNLAGNHTV